MDLEAMRGVEPRTTVCSGGVCYLLHYMTV